MQVPSLASLNGLRIWSCCKLWHRSADGAQIQILILSCGGIGLRYGSDLILAKELSYARGMPQKKKKKKKKGKKKECLFWLSRLRTKCSVHEDGGLIHGLGQWIKDLALIQAAA